MRFKAHKLYCYSGRRYFNQQFPGIGKYQRSAERLQEQVFCQHRGRVSQQSLAVNFKMGKATIERWYHKRYLRAYQEMKGLPCPQVLGIDEHSFSKKQGYVTTFCNLKKHKIVDIVKKCSAKGLIGYLEQLPGKEQVKVICIDLSSSYRGLIKQYFPNAKIVADHFHVVRLMLQMCVQTYQDIDPSMKNQRGLVAALRTHPDNLSIKRMKKRDEYLKAQPTVAGYLWI